MTLLAIGRVGGGVKHWSKLPTEYTKTLDMGEEGVKNQEKLPTLFIDGPYLRDLCHQGFLIWDHSCVNAPFLIHSPCVIIFFLFQNNPITKSNFTSELLSKNLIMK